MSVSAGTVASVIGFIASVLTLIIGLIHFVQKVEDLDVKFSDCSFFLEGCNGSWRKFTFRPNVFFELNSWTPLVFGLLGIGLHCMFVYHKIVLNYMTYAFFMIITALFASLSSVGWIVVLSAAFSVACVGLSLSELRLSLLRHGSLHELAYCRSVCQAFWICLATL
jgi:hypothetical protein